MAELILPRRNSKVDSTREEEYPFGEETGTLVVCINRMQRKEVQEAFKLKALYVLPGAALPSRPFDKIIIFSPHFEDGREMGRFKQWIENSVLPRRNKQGTVHYV